jgi:Arc/MetJ-type ribon-helix-helix transcriptional regulator
MTIELTQKSSTLVENAIKSGCFDTADDVVAAALELLAEDIEDAAVVNAREHEPRFTLEEVEAELRALGKLK